MKKILCLILFCIPGLMISFPDTGFTEETESLILPPPRTSGGKPLMQALKARASSRSFSGEKLPLQLISDLLWAAGGVNREDSGKRTAPSARDRREIGIYASTADGLYRYDAETHCLILVLKEDIRMLTGKQDFPAAAPLNLVFVADFDKTAGDTELEKTLYAGADTGFISQNVYLFCASEGLATVVRGYVDKSGLAEKMGLPPHQKVILAQTVGYPGK